MDRTIYRISLDVQANVCQRELNMRKKESGRRIIASLRDGRAHYHMEPDCRAVFAARKPDGKIIYNECIIDGCEIVYDITEQTTAAPGITKCEFLVYGGDNLLLVSPKFFIRVEDTVYNDGDEIESTSEFSALTAAMTEVNRLIEEVKNLGNDIDPEVIAEAVTEYLAANPVKETDPTVPAWAKQPTKPEYTAAEVGAQPKGDYALRRDLPGAVVFHISYVDEIYGYSHTVEELFSAYQKGANITCVCDISPNRIFNLKAATDTEIVFECLDVDGEAKRTRISRIVYTEGRFNMETDFVAVPTVPTKVSAFANDKGYQTEAEVNALINTALGVIENGTY